MLMMANRTILAGHARALPCVAHDPEARLRDTAASRGITERSAYGTVTDLAGAGYVARQKNGRRSRCQTRAHLPLPEPGRVLGWSGPSTRPKSTTSGSPAAIACRALPASSFR